MSCSFLVPFSQASSSHHYDFSPALLDFPSNEASGITLASIPRQLLRLNLQLDYRRIATFYGQGKFLEPPGHPNPLSWIHPLPKILLQSLICRAGATYDSIEGQFRKIRNGAKELRAKVETGEIPVAPPRGTKTNPSSPRKPSSAPKEKTIGGRVSKSVNSTPTRKGKSGRGIKEEVGSSASSFYDSKSELESNAEEVASWSADSQPVVEGGEFDFFLDHEVMEEGV